MIKLDNWCIAAEGYHTHTPQLLESIFSQSNGYMGVRASFMQDGALPYERCTFMAGGYDYISPGVTDLINLPDPFHFLITIEGSRPGLDRGEYSEFNQSLNLKDGLYTRESVWEDSCGCKTAIKISRFISMADKHIAALCIELTAVNQDCNTDVILGLDANVLNLPIHDDQTLVNDQTIQMLRVISEHSAQGQCSLQAESRTGRLKLEMNCRITSTSGEQTETISPGCTSRMLSISLERGQTVRIEKLISVNGDLPEQDFETLLANSRKVWARRWQDSDIEVEADDSTIQTALRYNLFQLMQNRPFDDPAVSIGARGLTHARYKGCYFWDTDIFLQPFYLYTDPNAARNLVRFRLDTMSDAKENAKSLNLEGARYPWMCAIGGKEQCHTWDIGRSEIHITADVAYAVEQYLKVSNDDGLRNEAARLFIETARYWVSRFSYSKADDAYNLLFIKGPDEYCGVSSNNAYTVMLARHNLRLAAEMVIRDGYGEDVESDEITQWQAIIEKSRVGYDSANDLFIQDDDFQRLEPFDINTKQGDRPVYHRYDYDRLQRYKVLKQADLILLMLLLPGTFTTNQKQAIWDCYEPITLHDSSLSYGIHAWAAAVLGHEDKATSYFNKSLFLDLYDLMGNTGAEGIHMAALGATWQAVVFGFAGLSMSEDRTPTLAPMLPNGWKSITFRFYMSGKQYRAEIKPGDVRITEVPAL